MTQYLREKGIMAEVLDGETNYTGATAGIVQRFSAGETQVICATKGTLHLLLYAFKCGVGIAFSMI